MYNVYGTNKSARIFTTKWFSQPNEKFHPKKQSTALNYQQSDFSNDETTSRNKWRLLIKFTTLSCSKKTLGKKKFDTDSFDICADFGASSCATPGKIDIIPGT